MKLQSTPYPLTIFTQPLDKNTTSKPEPTIPNTQSWTHLEPTFPRTIKMQQSSHQSATKGPREQNQKVPKQNRKTREREGRDLAHVPLYHTRGGIKLRHVTGPTKGDFQQKYIRVFGLNGAAVFQGPPGMIYTRHGPSYCWDWPLSLDIFSGRDGYISGEAIARGLDVSMHLCEDKGPFRMDERVNCARWHLSGLRVLACDFVCVVGSVSCWCFCWTVEFFIW